MKYKTIFLCNHPEQVNYVYSPDRKARLAELTDLREGTVTAEELANGGFSDVEIVFSTWGMPSLSEEELAKYLPNLKAVFYGAGAGQRHGFAVDAGADAGLAALPVAGAVDFAAVAEVSLE